MFASAMRSGLSKPISTPFLLITLSIPLLLAGCPSFQKGPQRRYDPKHFVDIGPRGKVFFRASGPEDGPVVFLVHGFAGTSSHWAPIQPALAKAGFRTISVDVPGNGRSDKLAGDYSPAGLARALHDVLDKLGVKEAHLVGHSWGTSLVLAMAIHKPKRALSIALIGSWVYEDQLPPFITWSRAPGIGEVLFTVFLHQFIDERMGLSFHDPHFWAAQPKFIDLAREMTDAPGWTAAALAASRQMRFREQQRKYRSLAQPVLVMHGQGDPIARLPWARRLAGEVPNARLVIIDQSRHFPQLEQPAKVLRALVPFLKRASASRTSKPRERVKNKAAREWVKQPPTAPPPPVSKPATENNEQRP
jgi:pimeloyl-ACP methyl ester carboxylesterase